ncbi:MAG TPA: hypothetical protein VL793_03600 [Patescibacteria group bacterium]|jgi:hypothetical protein|nr:hypothetical protein [Patescibacteria group bacterium]
MIHPDDPVSEGKATQSDPTSVLVGREDFWADTCREITEMQHASHEVVELYRRYGCRFCPPGRQQVQYVLTALDSAVAGWDKEHPELFYQTLELNYPELVKRG